MSVRLHIIAIYDSGVDRGSRRSRNRETILPVIEIGAAISRVWNRTDFGKTRPSRFYSFRRFCGLLAPPLPPLVPDGLSVTTVNCVNLRRESRKYNLQVFRKPRK